MWKALGWIFVAIGAVGVVIPLLPTVPFLLLAAYCFKRGSPTLHAWLWQHPTFGPPLRDWDEHGVIRWRAKFLAVSCISSSVGYVISFRHFSIWLKAAAVATCLAMVIFILTRRSYRRGEHDGV